MLGAEARDLLELDLGVLGTVDGGASDPPIGAWQAGGQVCTGPSPTTLLRRPGLSNHFAVRRLPQPDQITLFTEHNGVVPTEDHRLGAVWRGRDGYQMAR